VSLVSINPEGSHNHSARDARALAEGRLSLLLALEVAPSRHPGKRKKFAKDIMGQRMPADQRRLVPKLPGGVSWILSARANDRTSRRSHGESVLHIPGNWKLM
jgi:hypothetical protein